MFKMGHIRWQSCDAFFVIQAFFVVYTMNLLWQNCPASNSSAMKKLRHPLPSLNRDLGLSRSPPQSISRVHSPLWIEPRNGWAGASPATRGSGTRASGPRASATLGRPWGLGSSRDARGQGMSGVRHHGAALLLVVVRPGEGRRGTKIYLICSQIKTIFHQIWTRWSQGRLWAIPKRSSPET
jgi:hypothetical protein